MSVYEDEGLDSLSERLDRLEAAADEWQYETDDEPDLAPRLI